MAPRESKIIAILPLDNRSYLVNSSYYKILTILEKSCLLPLKSVSIGKSGILFASHSLLYFANGPGKRKLFGMTDQRVLLKKIRGFISGL